METQQTASKLYPSLLRSIFYFLFLVSCTTSVVAQTTSVGSVPAEGWYRIAYNNTGAGRGFGKISMYVNGGSYTPQYIDIHWFKDWQYKAGIKTESSAITSSYWSEVRITFDSTIMYVEVYFTRELAQIQFISDAYGWKPCSLYSGALPIGGGTVRASAKTNGHMNINNHMLVGFNGNVGIGTTVPRAKLAVEGNILAKEIKVTNNIAVPDYVFEPDYNLPSLSEVQTYVKENKHLPEIPSAKDIERDGLDLGEMNLLLLKKVEELTLYVIQLEERMSDMEKSKTEE